MASVLLDTGPLVALFKRNDTHHKRAVAWFKAQRATLLTTQAVVTESWHLVSRPARLPLVQFVTAACDIAEFGSDGHLRVASVLQRYADLPMDYADATLLVVAELHGVGSIATIDVNDFCVYRLSNGRPLRLVF